MRDRLIPVLVGLAILATTEACTPASHSPDSVALSAQVDALCLREIAGCASALGVQE